MSPKPTIFTRGRFQMKYRGTECLNCGHPIDLNDNYCPNCSQVNSTKKLSIKDFIDEFVSNIIDFDSRVLKTLKIMMLRPGVISREYVAGKRMRYANPFRFMFSLAIIYFLLLGLSGDYSELDRFGSRDESVTFDPTYAINLVMNDQEERNQAANALDSLGVREQIIRAQEHKDSLILSDPEGYFKAIQDSSMLVRIGNKHDFYYTILRKDSVFSFGEAAEKYNIANVLENKVAFNIAGSTLKVARQPGSFVNSLISKIPFATFFFLPVFTIFIVLVYIRKTYTYTDNLIFSFHNQSVFFILLIISFLADLIFNSSTAWVALTIFSIYLYKAMRNFYGQGRFKTILKYLFLNFVFFILAGITTLLFILGSAFTY